MTYYAKHNGVGTADHLPEGAIEITAQRYKELLVLQASGMRVTVIDGEAVDYDPPVYRPDGTEAKEYTPGDPLITEAPPTDLHVPEWQNGAWVEGETAEQKQNRKETHNKLLKNDIRNQRDLLLAESDWTQVPDAPVDQQTWAEYRQALRDVPQQSGFPTDINWPTKPE